MSIEKIHVSESRKPLSRRLLFNFSLFRLHFVSALHNLDCCYNEYPVKQTASYYLELSLKPAFFRVFLILLLILNFFISGYLDQIFPQKNN